MKNIINEYTKKYQYLMNRHQLWEILKVTIKESTLSYCYKRVKNQKSEIQNLQTKLDDLTEKSNKQEPNQNDTLKQINDTKIQLNNLLETATQGSYIRSKTEWCEKGDRNSKFFMNLENKRQSSNTINHTKTSNGNYVYKQNDIMKELSTFYENLFKSNKTSNENVNQYFSKVTIDKNWIVVRNYYAIVRSVRKS